MNTQLSPLVRRTSSFPTVGRSADSYALPISTPRASLRRPCRGVPIVQVTPYAREHTCPHHSYISSFITLNVGAFTTSVCLEGTKPLAVPLRISLILPYICSDIRLFFAATACQPVGLAYISIVSLFKFLSLSTVLSSNLPKSVASHLCARYSDGRC